MYGRKYDIKGHYCSIIAWKCFGVVTLIRTCPPISKVLIPPWRLSPISKSNLNKCQNLDKPRFWWGTSRFWRRGRLSSKVVFHQRLSVKGHLPSKVVFRQRSSSVKDYLPSKIVFGQKLSSVLGCPPSKVIFQQRSSSVQGHLPKKGRLP